MALVKWDPFRDVAQLQNRINRMFDESFGRSRELNEEAGLRSWRPPVDIYETAGGIVLPDSAREKPQQGKVIAAGPGKLIEKSGERGQMSLKVGDRVFYGKYSGTEIEINGEDYVILRESDVLAVQV